MELGLNYRRAPNQVHRFNGVGRTRYQSFRAHHESVLPDILQAAARLYRRRIKQIHPDVNGSHEACVRLNLVWGRINKLFQQKL